MTAPLLWHYTRTPVDVLSGLLEFTYCGDGDNTARYLRDSRLFRVPGQLWERVSDAGN